MTKHQGPTNKCEFEFDLNGFTIIRGFIPQTTVDAMNQSVEESLYPVGRHKFDFIESGELFFKQIFDARVMKYCEKWIGSHFRFDHAWGVHFGPNNTASRENLHAGPFQNQGFFQYNWYNNHPKTSCLLFCYVLKDQPQGEGGLVLLPGSHKLNYPITTHASVELFEGFYGKDFASIPSLVQPSLQAGDLLIMSEATIHGTARWTSSIHWRRNLYYKYCHGFMGWLPHDNATIARLRNRASGRLECRVLERPYVCEENEGAQSWRAPTNSI